MGLFVDNLLSGLGTGIASKAVSSGFGAFDKKEKRLSPTVEGYNQKKYFKALYGNKLNPWEWAGAGGHGQGGTAAPNAAGLQARKTSREQQNTQQGLQTAQAIMQQKQLDNNIEVAKIQAGLTPGKDVPPQSQQGQNIQKIGAEIQNIKTKNDILRTAKSFSDEIQDVIGTIKGDKQTMLKQAQDATSAIIEEASKNASGNINLMKQRLQSIWKSIKGAFNRDPLTEKGTFETPNRSNKTKRKPDMTLRKYPTSAPRLKK